MRDHSLRLRLGRHFGCAALAAVLAASGCSNESPGSSTGAAGTSGAAGTQGTAGTTGAAGTQGAAGTTGAAGTQGAAGTTGAAGTQGAAGTTGAAGTQGAAGTTGAAGTQGAAGTTGAGGTSGMPNAVRSAGCGTAAPTTQTLGTYVKFMETVPASTVTKGKWLNPRSYWVWLPPNYDPNHAYPTVFVGPGCGGTGDKSIQIQKASGNDAIAVGLDYNADATGRACFNTETFPDPEVEFVENTVKLVEQAYCVDKSRLFIEGFSSGSWLSYLMGCVDGGPGGLFKGQGNASGEMQGVPADACKGPIAYMAGHNNPDGNNAYPGGRDHMIKINGCTMPPVTMPYDPGPMVKAPNAGVTINCVQYMGCKAPTVFCTTTGVGHDPQENTGISTYGFWKFWMSLP